MEAGARAASALTAAVELTRGQLLDLMLDAEDKLRGMVRSVLSQTRLDWTELIPEEIKRKLDDVKARQDKNVWNVKWRADPLDSATVGQLVQVIDQLWPSFEPILQDRIQTLARLGQFRSFRNDLAHGLDPEPDTKIEIALLVSQLTGLIPPVVRYTQDLDRVDSFALTDAWILWVDDVPENNRTFRQWFEHLGAVVVPVLSNDEAVREASKRHYDLAISDIDRTGSEPGSRLGVRLREAQISIPIVFFVGRVDADAPPLAQAIAITNDPAEMLRAALNSLKGGGSRTP